MPDSSHVLDLDVPPSLPRELLRAALSPRPSRPSEVPRIEVRLRRLIAQPQALARYREVEAFTTRGFLPLTYPQVLAAPLHLVLLNHRAFPYPLLGMIHVRNRIQQWRRLEDTAALDFQVSVEGQREVRQGRELDVHTRVEQDGTLVWSASTLR